MVTATANPTYLDLMKLIGPDGNIMEVSELLMQSNDGILDYISFIEGNMENGHLHAVRTGLPTVSRGRINKGVVATKGNTAQVMDTCAELESLSEIDAKLVDKASDPMAFRMTQDRGHIEAMNQQFVFDLFKGDETLDPDQYTGFEARYSDSTAANADNIINGFGAATSGLTAGTDTSSIWLVVWSPLTCTGIIPKRSTANLQMMDEGVCWIDDDGSNTGARLKVYRTMFRWLTGLAIPDWRYVVRIPNIKLSLVTDDAATGPNLPVLMKDALERVPSLSMGRAAFYMNRSLMQKLRRQIASGVNASTLTMENVGGINPSVRPTIDGVPVFRTDTLANPEAKVDFT